MLGEDWKDKRVVVEGMTLEDRLEYKVDRLVVCLMGTALD